jgi:4-hydroxybenzoyl-CoA reductase subunit beta
MLRMPEFEVLHPTTPEEAVALCAAHDGARYVAGGTDLLPNLKHGLLQPPHLINLRSIASLKGISRKESGGFVLGALTSLHEIAESESVQSALPGLSQAAGLVAGPQHRRMGTIGGNVMLDTRCLYYNQTPAWRHSLGYCLKAEGDWCHVIGSKATCVAANSADTVPVLLAMNAKLHLMTGSGALVMELAQLYQQNGMANHSIDPHTLITAIEIPPQGAGHRSVYRKVRARNAIDFPQLGLAVVATFDGTRCTALSAVINAIMPKPKVLKKLEAAVGTELPDDVIKALGAAAFKQTRPQTSIHGDPAWRKHMARVEMQRALKALRDDPNSQARSL